MNCTSKHASTNVFVQFYALGSCCRDFSLNSNTRIKRFLQGDILLYQDVNILQRNKCVTDSEMQLKYCKGLISGILIQIFVTEKVIVFPGDRRRYSSKDTEDKPE